MPLLRARLAPRVKYHYRPLLQVRYQHDPPHKEYFQNALEYPLAPPSTPTLTAPADSPATDSRSIRRLLQPILWAVLFGGLGFAYVDVPRTMRWLDRSKRDSQREEADMQKIQQKFKDDPLVKILEADPSWHSAQPGPSPETDPYPFVRHIDPYMSKAIGGSQGLQMKFYQNPSKAMMCCIVHVGEGVEGGPRIAHSGALAGLVEDSFDWLGSKITLVTLGKSKETTAVMSNKTMQIDILKDVPTGRLYALWMVPALCLGEDIADVLNVKDLRGPKLTTDELRRTVIGMLERRDSLPYEPGKSERFVRARVTYDVDTTKPTAKAFVIM